MTEQEKKTKVDRTAEKNTKEIRGVVGAADGDMNLLPKHWVRYLASRASNGKYGAHCPKYGFPPMSRHERD